MSDHLHEQDVGTLEDFAWSSLTMALKTCEDTGTGPREQDRQEILRRMKTLMERLDG